MLLQSWKKHFNNDDGLTSFTDSLFGGRDPGSPYESVVAWICWVTLDGGWWWGGGVLLSRAFWFVGGEGEVEV